MSFTFNLPFNVFEESLRAEKSRLCQQAPAMQTVPFVTSAVDPMLGESEAEDLLLEISVEQIRRGERQMPVETRGILQTSSGTSTPSSSVLAALKSVMPNSIDEEVLPSSSIISQDMKVFKSPLHRQILFSVANNFAGLGASEIGSVIRFLRTGTDETLYQLILHSPGFSSRAIAQNIFKGAIEAGDATVVDLLLTNKLTGIDVNQQLCSVDGESFTPIERASALHHAGVIRSLLRHHADVNQTLRPRQSFGGALNCAMGVPYGIYGRVDPEIFRMLLQAGSDLSDRHLLYIIEYRDTEFVSLIMSKYARKNVIKWSKRGVFHKAVEILEEQTSIDIIKIMLDVGADLDYSYKAGPYNTTPQRVIDVAAQRGSLEMVKVLLNNRASLSGDTLTYAVKSTNEDLIHFLLEGGADINSIGPLGMTALEAAISIRNARIISLLEERGTCIDLKDPKHVSAALIAASKAGDVAFARYLLQLECQISPDGLGRALMGATRSGFEEVAMLLLDAGAETFSSLAYALEACSPAFVLALLDAGANPNDSLTDEDKVGAVPVLIAIKQRNRSAVEALLFAGADVNKARDYDVNEARDYEETPEIGTALTRAVTQEDFELVQLLLDYGADINTRTVNLTTVTALEAAAANGDLRMARFLLDRGADPHDSRALGKARLKNRELFDLLIQEHKARYPMGRKGFGSEALAQAIEMCEDCDVRVLLEIGGNGDAMTRHDHQDVTPFGLAISNEKKGACGFTELFLLRGYDPNGIVSEIDYGLRLRTTALLAAIGTHNSSTVELLIRHGANCNLAAWGSVKRTPLQRAAETGSIDLVELLLNHGANVNGPAATRDGGTALQLAAIGGYIPIACMLLNRKAEVDAPGSKVNGRTALEGAAEHGRLDMVQLLLNAKAGSSGRDLAQFARAKALAKDNGHFYISDLLDSHTKPQNHFSQLNMAVDDDYESMVNWNGNGN